jgi:hypothetical protein
MNNLDVVCRLKARPRESVYVNLNWIATNSSILIAGGRLESEAGS